MSSNEAQKQNPALKPLSVLIGKWKTIGSHPLIPGKILHGFTTFEWLEGGAFIVMRSEIDEPEIPSGIAIFGSDNVTREYFMIYFDERGISRKYDVLIDNNKVSWSRNTPEFSQRMILNILDDQKKIISKGEMSKEGDSWEPDLELTYTLVE
jgi:hypothetical protein